MNMEYLVNKTVVVTGANSGNGFAILKKLASIGMKAVGFDIQIDEIENIAKDFPGNIFYQQVDVCDYEALRKAFKYVEEVCGSLEVLINNAGVMIPGNILDDNDENMEGILKTVDVNFSGPVRCCRLAYNLMKQSDFGYIININSVAGHYIPKPAATNVYCPTKYAITALTEILRQELIGKENDKIRVTSISPGVVSTNLFKNCSEAIQRKMYEKQSLETTDIADAVCYLLSLPSTVNVTELTIRATANPF